MAEEQIIPNPATQNTDTDTDYLERIARVRAEIENPRVTGNYRDVMPLRSQFFTEIGLDDRSPSEEKAKRRSKFTDGLTDLVGY